MRKDFNYFCFDLDGTLTGEELLPKIAARVGMEEVMSELTSQAISGDIPFEVSLSHRVELLKSIPISTVQEVVFSVKMNPLILEFIQKNIERCAIITGNLDVWIAPLLNNIGVKYFCSKAAFEADQLLGLKNILNKSDAIQNLPRPLVAVGDGNNDVGMLSSANVSIAYGGVHPPAAPLLDIATHAIYSERELCRFLNQLL